MDFFKRFTWYMLGVSFGVVFVVMMLSGRDDIACTYFPDSRVKANILEKKINFDQNSLNILMLHEIDTVDLKEIIEKGDVIFSKSNTDLDSCKIYFIENVLFELKLENCDSIVNIISLQKK